MFNHYISDCPAGYDCPKIGSVDPCMVKVGENVKFHSGCFLENNEEKLGRPWNVDDCAANCNEDALCKGFGIGYGDKYLTKKGCVFATTKDCSLIWGAKEFPYPPNSGDLLETPNVPKEMMKKYGFTGCYRKTSLGKW